MKNILITFSGGRTSALMCRIIQDLPKYKNFNKLFVFANTGKEKEETLKFIDRCDKEFNLNLVWLEANINQEKGIGTEPKIVSYETASRNGEPFEDLIKKYGLPSKLYRHCTRELKEVPIHKYTKRLFKSEYLTAIGIRADEKHRLIYKDNKIYPLAEAMISEEIVRDWWSKQDFDLGIKDYEGNCDFCFLKSIRKKLTLITENPDSIEWWNKMEVKYPKDRQPIFDVYRDMKIASLVEMSQKPFRKVIDKYELKLMTNQMFDPIMDLEFDCFCKSN